MIYLIRHGQTDMNSAHVLQGRSDHPLNGNGVRQAREAAQMLAARGIAFEHVFTSPLLRAVQTAEILSPGVSPVRDERLIEMDCGLYEGADLTHPPRELAAFFQDFAHNPPPEGMEPLSAVTARVGAFLEEIKALDGNILISTHAVAMKGALEYLTPDANGVYWPMRIGNCAVFAVDNSPDGFGLPEGLLP